MTQELESTIRRYSETNHAYQNPVNGYLVELLAEIDRLRDIASPFINYDNCMESTNTFKWIKVTTQEYDALREAL